jgi:hypothetical protein
VRYRQRIIRHICIPVGHKYDSLQLDVDERYRYDEVRTPYVEQLAFLWMEDSTTEIIRASVDKKIDKFAKGDLRHATPTLATLWEIANREGDVEAPSTTASAVSSSWFSFLVRHSRISYISRPPRPARIQHAGPS